MFEPLRTRLQRTINRLMYGERDAPYEVLTRLSQRLKSTLAPEAVLPTSGETIAQALKLPYVALSLKQEKGFELLQRTASPMTMCSTCHWSIRLRL